MVTAVLVATLVLAPATAAEPCSWEAVVDGTCTLSETGPHACGVKATASPATDYAACTLGA